MLQIQCPHCQNIAQIPDSVVGKTVRCGTCGKTFLVKGTDDIPLDIQDLPADKPGTNAKANATTSPRFCGGCGEPWQTSFKHCPNCGHNPSYQPKWLGIRHLSTSTKLKLVGWIAAIVIVIILGVKVRNFVVSKFDEYNKEQQEELRLQAERDTRKKAEDAAAAAKWLADAPKRKAAAEAAEAAENARILEQARIRDEQERARQEKLAQESARAEKVAQEQKISDEVIRSSLASQLKDFHLSYFEHLDKWGDININTAYRVMTAKWSLMALRGDAQGKNFAWEGTTEKRIDSIVYQLKVTAYGENKAKDKFIVYNNLKVQLTFSRFAGETTLTYFSIIQQPDFDTIRNDWPSAR